MISEVLKNFPQLNKVDRYIHPVAPETVQRGIVIEGTIGDTATVAFGREGGPDRYVFQRNIGTKNIREAQLRLAALRYHDPDEASKFVLGVAINEDENNSSFNHEDIGLWLLASDEIKVAPLGVLEVKIRPVRSEGQKPEITI